MKDPSAPAEAWQPTACILCSRNCGIEVTVEDGHLKKIRGDKASPLSRGYNCQKATRLEHYQTNADRLSAPLRRRPDGSFEEVSWEVAVAEIAGELNEVTEAGSLRGGSVAEGQLRFQQDAGEGGIEFAVQDGGCGGRRRFRQGRLRGQTGRQGQHGGHCHGGLEKTATGRGRLARVHKFFLCCKVRTKYHRISFAQDGKDSSEVTN